MYYACSISIRFLLTEHIKPSNCSRFPYSYCSYFFQIASAQKLKQQLGRRYSRQISLLLLNYPITTMAQYELLRLIVAKGLQFIQWALELCFLGLHASQTQMLTPGMKNHQLSLRTDLSGTKSNQASSPCITYLATAQIECWKYGNHFKFGHLCIRWHHTLTCSDFLR